MIIGAWLLRNEREAGYRGFSTISAYYTYCYQAASVLAVDEKVPYYKKQHDMGCPDRQIYLQNHPEQKGWDRGRIYSFMQKEGIKIILREPFTYFLIHVKGMFRTLVDPGVTEYLFLFKQYSWSRGCLVRYWTRACSPPSRALPKQRHFSFLSF
jgi:hypothetical protein